MKVLVVFSDSTLGGTSRSALQSVRAWNSLDAATYVSSATPVHPERSRRLEEMSSQVPWGQLSRIRPDIVHFHHGGYTAALTHQYRQMVSDLGPYKPVLITTNIFARPDRMTRDWPGPRTVTVLGRWAQAQYTAGLWPFEREPTPTVLGNPQNDRFWRLPTRNERASARQALGLSDSHVCLLRIGSPLEQKWAPSYQVLADRIRTRSGQHVLHLVGAPASFGEMGPRVFQHAPISDDRGLRCLYWAADRFVLDAVRGESFGNVIAESLLCGAPVLYRGRPFRDNTPFEMQSLPGFMYAHNSSEWIDAALAPVDRLGSEEREKTAARYGQAAYARALGNILVGGHRSDRLEDQLKIVDRAKVFVQHNPVALVAKAVRSNVRSAHAS